MVITTLPGISRGVRRRSPDGGRRHALQTLVGVLAAVLLSTSVSAQSAIPLGGRANTWAARSSRGQTFAGTWTATEDPKTRAVTGTWTLIDAQRRVVARGGWSAAKSPSGWTGSWRAVATGRQGEYAGTWTATTALDPESTLAALFATALEAAVSGTWAAGRETGTWTIRAFK